MELHSFLSEVLQSHPDVRMQQAHLEVGRQDLSIARQQFFPTPSVSVEQAKAAVADSQYQGDPQIMVLRLQQPLWTGGRLTAGLAKSQASLDARQAVLEETRQQLAMSTVESWGAWCAADARLTVIEHSLSLLRDLQAKVERRVHEGASAPSELIMTESRVAQAVAQKRGQQAQLEMARSRLAQLLGQPILAQACPAWPGLSPWSGAGLDQITADVLDHHPSLTRLRAQIRQVEQEVNERKADFWPEVYVRAEHQRGNYTIANYPTTNRVFIGMNSRFGAGLSTPQQVASAVQRQQAAEQELDGGQRKALEQAQSLWIQLQDVQARLPALEQVSKANWATQEAWDRQFLAGRKSWLDVMNAARESMQSELELADARVTEKSLLWRLGLFVQGVDSVLAAASEPRH